MVAHRRPGWQYSQDCKLCVAFMQRPLPCSRPVVTHTCVQGCQRAGVAYLLRQAIELVEAEADADENQDGEKQGR